MKKAFLIFIGILFLVTTPSFALMQTFFGYDDGGKVLTNSNAARNDFFSNLVGVGTEDFELFTDGQPLPLIADFGAAGTATMVGSGAIQEGDSTGRWAISGSKYLEVPGSSSSLFSINFSEAIAAFGFFGTDIGDFDGQLTLTTVNGASKTYVIPHPTGQGNFDFNALYFGIIDTENLYTSVTFANTGSGADFFGFDDFSIGTIENVQPVPEPSTLLLMGAGLLGLVAVGRRKFSPKE